MDKDIAEKVDSFFTKFKHQTYKKGEMLIRADEEPAGIFYLKHGKVKCYVISKNGDEVVVNIFKPPAFFPMSWAINKASNIYFYEALDEAEVWRAPKDAAITFIKDNPAVLYDLLARVYKGTDGLLIRTAYLMSGSAHLRLITELVIQAKRFGQKRGTGIVLKTSEKDLASETGMTRETVSREIKALKDKKLLDFSRNLLVIYNLEKLEVELDYF